MTFEKLRNRKTRLFIILFLAVLMIFVAINSNRAEAATYNITLDANPSALQRDQQTTLSARVTDEFSIPYINEPVDFYDDDIFIGNAMSDDQGYAIFAYTIPSDATFGIHILRAELSGSPEYNYTTNINILGDELSITLEITPDRQLKGSTVELKATVLDNSSNPFPDVTIDFYDETSAENYWILSTTTDNDGIVIYDWQIPINRPVGVHQINATATIPLSGEILVAYATIEFLNPYTIDLELSSTDINRGGIVTINATVTDSLSSAPEVGVTVNFYDNETLIGSAITDDQGLATYDYTVPLDADYGVHTIKATVYEGDPNFSDVSESLTVYMNVTVNAIFSSTTVEREDSIIVSVTVTDESTNGLSDYTVELYDATIDQVIASNVTDSNGQTELTYGIPVDSTVGEHDLVVRLVNIPQYVLSNEVQEKVYVFANTDLHIELQVADAEPGDTVEIIATLTDNILNGLEGYTIFFYAGDTLLGSQTTDLNGIALFQWLVDNSLLGTQQIRAEFMASGYYHSSTSDIVTIAIHSSSITILNDLTVESGEQHTVKVQVREDGEPKADINVEIYAWVDGEWLLVDEATTNDEGEAELTMTVQDEIGTQKIKIVSDIKTTTKTLTVKYKPDIDLDLDEGIELGDTCDIKLTIKDYNNEPIQVKVSIWFDDELLISEKTDEDGCIEVSVTPDTIGEYKVKIKFDSIQDAINVETIEKTVMVGERLYIDVQENPDSTLTIVFQYANGTALSNTSVDFYIDGYGENNVNANSEYLQGLSQGDYYTTIQTDEYGVATFSMKEFDNGDYLIRLVFYRIDIKKSVEIEIQTTVEQGGLNLPLIAFISDMSLLFSIVTVIGVCGAISGLMYFFFIRTQPDPLSSLSELQSDSEIEGVTQMVDLGLAYQRPSFLVSEMVDPTEFGVKAIFLVEFDIIMGPIIKEFRVFNEQTEFSSVIMDPTKLTSFYTMAVTRDQFKLEEPNENIYVRLVTVEENTGIQGETVTQNLLIIVTEKEEYNENWVKHLIETLLVEWPDQQGYLAHQMDQFVPKGIELNIPALL